MSHKFFTSSNRYSLKFGGLERENKTLFLVGGWVGGESLAGIRECFAKSKKYKTGIKTLNDIEILEGITDNTEIIIPKIK